MPRRRLLHFAFVAVVGTSVGLGSAGVVSAQMPPYTAYGMGLPAGDLVTAAINGVDCGSARVSAAGNWKISIPAEAPCQPKDGSTVHFAVNGKEHAATVRWSGGGAPLNPRIGVALGASVTPTATATAKVAPTSKPTATKSPTPTPTAKATATAAKTPTPKATVTATPRRRLNLR
ncbi:MAG: hypothetical protein EPO65_03385 [Dehalococcoidia bacterium]|nr:MAG: hypothetical protein EPO65_03385 [Dehalococcoidia bacterium]